MWVKVLLKRLIKLLKDKNSLIPTPQTDLIVEDVTQMDPLSRNRRAAESATNQFRPLRLTEMMHFCCRYGCSFRDLLPYCDPFGQWDS
uniref:Insulin-like domain-containing protein n=1 Tax=Panagrolaimus sp. PS1159 TaxID=55785 RepID=A0AC35FLM6_9BILA